MATALTRIIHTLDAGSGDPAYRDWPGGVVGRVPSRGEQDVFEKTDRSGSISPTLRSDDLVTDAVPSGIYFRLNLGGATGHKAFARDLGATGDFQQR